MRLQLGKFSRAFSLLVLPLFTSAVASAGVTVSVSSPAAGSTVSSPTTIRASATSGNPISGWHIYIDDQSAWTTGATGSISAGVSLPTGTHKVYVRAWDTTGAYGTSSTFYLTSGGTSSGVSVNVTSPAPGATVGFPTTIAANASSGYPITGWYVYVDDVGAWSTGAAQSINASVNIPSGTHKVYVRAWNSSGASGTSSTFYLTGSGSTGTVAPSSGEPMPPAGAKLIDTIEQQTGWGHCTDCAADPSNPNPPIALYSFTQFQNTPSLDGSAVKMWIGGTTPYANALHWKKFGDQSAYKNFIWEFWIYGNADMNNAQNLEFDLFQAAGGRKYMFGTQCNYWKKIWQGWDETTNHWVDTTTPCPKFPTGQWNRIKWYMQRTSDNRLHYVSVTVNNTTYKVDRYWNSAATSWGNTFGVQFQQDLNSSAADYTVWADKVKVWMW